MVSAVILKDDDRNRRSEESQELKTATSENASLVFFAPSSRPHSFFFVSRSGSCGKAKGKTSFAFFSNSVFFTSLLEEHGSYCGLTITQMGIKITTWPDA